MIKRERHRGRAGGGAGFELAGKAIAQSHLNVTTMLLHGQILGDVWRKAVKASLHMLRRPRAWAVDCQDLDAAERCGARFVCIRDLESLQEYWSHVETLRRYGFVLDRGHGRQIALGLERWVGSRAEAEAAESVGARQMTLWDVAA